MLPLGTQAPPFRLPDVSGNVVSLDDASGARALLIMFICNHCPYVVHVKDEILRIAREYSPRGVAFVAISSNDVAAYPADNPAKMREFAHAAGFMFP